MNRAGLKMFEQVEKNEVLPLLLYQSLSRLTYKVENGVEFHGKPILIEEARSQ